MITLAVLVVRVAGSLPGELPPDDPNAAGAFDGRWGQGVNARVPDVPLGGEQGTLAAEIPATMTRWPNARQKTRCAFCEAARAALGLTARALTGKK